MTKPISVLSMVLLVAGAPFLSGSPAHAESPSDPTGYQVQGTRLDRATWLAMLDAAHGKFVKAGSKQGRNIQVIYVTSAPGVGTSQRVFSQNADGSSVSKQVDSLWDGNPNGELVFEQRCLRLDSCQDRIIGTEQWKRASRNANRIDLNLSALLPDFEALNPDLGSVFFQPAPTFLTYITRGRALTDSILVDLKHTEDVLEIRIWEGGYFNSMRIETNARRVPVVDPSNPNGYVSPPLTRAEAENLTANALRRQIAADISDDATAKGLNRFVMLLDSVPERQKRSRWDLGSMPKVASQWKSFTPKVCRITPRGQLVTNKAGNCSLGVVFRSGDSGEFRMGKQIRFTR